MASTCAGTGRVLAQPLLVADEVLKPAQQVPTAIRAAGGRSWQGRLLAWGLLIVCSLGILGFLYVISSTDNSQLLTVYNAGLDSSLALKATLLDTAVLWTGNSLTAQQVLFSVVPTAAALVVVTPGPSSPVRRAPHQPFLSVSPEVPLPADTINAAVGAVEVVLGRQLFPISITMVDMAAQRTSTAGGVRPYVVWEVGSGTVLVDKYLVTQAWANPKVQHMSGLLAEHLFKALAQALSTAGEVQLAGWAAASLHDSLPGLMGPALSTAVAAAFAAAPPLWFCIVCPAVLGLLAPLLINIGLNQLAGYLCTHMSLPDDQCFDLLLGALGLGFVLALASAIPIFYVCKLAECAHRNGTGGVQRLQSGTQLHLTSKLRRHAAA